MPKIVKKYGKITLILGLILMLVVVYGLIPSAKAADLTKERDTLSDSRPSQISQHTVIFRATTAVPLSGHVIVDFPDGFSTPSMDYTDVAIYWDASDPPTTECTMAAACDATHCCATITSGTDTVDITLKSGAGISADDYVKVVIGDGASGGWEDITNPTAATYTVDLTTQNASAVNIDTGKCMVAIISGVTVSATVSETLSFAIDLVTNANCDTSFSVLGGPDSTATTVPFGTLAAVDTFYHACQDLTLSTNATNGYAITVQELTNLRDTAISKNIADSTGDNGTMTESTSDTWATATGNDGFGYSCANNAGGGTDCAFTYTNYRQFACTGSDANCDPGSGAETPQTVMSNANPVSGSSSRIEYKLSVSGTQQAGTYSNTIVYIATPTY